MSASRVLRDHNDLPPIGGRSPVNLVPQRKFYQIGGGENMEKMEAVSEIFHRILTPLYGDQNQAIMQIAKSTDRRCYLLYEGETPLGVLVFKTVLSDEFKKLGIERSIEVKSLFVDNSHENSGRGIGSELITKLKAESEGLGLDYTGIHVTVSENKTDSLAFFQKKGFTIAHAWKNRYKEGVTEFLLKCPRTIATATEQLTRQLSSLTMTAARIGMPSLLYVVSGIHYGAIHGLVGLSDGTFLSGSEDNSIYKWNENGDVVREVEEVEPSEQSEKNWITAMTAVNSRYFVTGKRSGVLSLWKTSGDKVRNLWLNFPHHPSHISKPLNERRITALAPGLDPDSPSVFVCRPTEFEEFDLIEGKSVSSTKVDQNDWPYTIKPLSVNRVLVAIGCRIEAWAKGNDKKWNRSATVLEEGSSTKTANPRPTKHKPFFLQRPFISSLAELDKERNLFALSDFTKTVKVLDVTTGAVVRSWSEHEQMRVWSTEKLSKETFASCGEDGQVKIWDIREERSVHTLNNSKRSINALLNLQGSILVAGSTGGRESADMFFYDLKK